MHPTVTVHNHGDNGAMKVSAEEGQISLDPETSTLKLSFIETQIESGGALRADFPKETEFKVPLSGAMQARPISHRSPSELPLRYIGNERIQQDSRTHAAIGEMAAHTGFSILTSNSQEIANAPGEAYSKRLKESKKRLTRLHVEPWRRWAEGFSCLFFVLVGAPLAIIAKTSDYWTTFGLCFLPTLLIYFPLFMFGLEQAKDSIIPPYGVWMSNFLLGSIGLFLIARVRRY